MTQPSSSDPFPSVIYALQWVEDDERGWVQHCANEHGEGPEVYATMHEARAVAADYIRYKRFERIEIVKFNVRIRG